MDATTEARLKSLEERLDALDQSMLGEAADGEELELQELGHKHFYIERCGNA